MIEAQESLGTGYLNSTCDECQPPRTDSSIFIKQYLFIAVRSPNMLAKNNLI